MASGSGDTQIGRYPIEPARVGKAPRSISTYKGPTRPAGSGGFQYHHCLHEVRMNRRLRIEFVFGLNVRSIWTIPSRIAMLWINVGESGDKWVRLWIIPQRRPASGPLLNESD